MSFVGPCGYISFSQSFHKNVPLITRGWRRDKKRKREREMLGKQAVSKVIKDYRWHKAR